MAVYYEVKISAENQEQADTILNSLLAKKLVTGGQCLSAPLRCWWKGKIIEMKEYVTITAYTTGKRKDALIADAPDKHRGGADGYVCGGRRYEPGAARIH